MMKVSTMQLTMYQARSFSNDNFGSSDQEPEKVKYTTYDPNAEEPEIDPEEYKRMQASL